MILHGKMKSCKFVLNKLRDKIYLRFPFDIPNGGMEEIA